MLASKHDLHSVCLALREEKDAPHCEQFLEPAGAGERERDLVRRRAGRAETPAQSLHVVNSALRAEKDAPHAVNVLVVAGVAAARGRGAAAALAGRASRGCAASKHSLHSVCAALREFTSLPHAQRKSPVAFSRALGAAGVLTARGCALSKHSLHSVCAGLCELTSLPHAHRLVGSAAGTPRAVSKLAGVRHCKDKP